MLRNRFYVGEVCYKNEIYPGPQPQLLDRALFDAVQTKLTEQWSHRTTTRSRSSALLRGLLFDDAGHPMCATHATKNGVRYRYYVAQPYLRGLASAPPGTITRVPATDIEAAIVSALKAQPQSAHKSVKAKKLADRDLVVSSVSRIEIRKNHLAVWLKPLPSQAGNGTSGDQAGDETLPETTADPNATPLLIPWSKPPFKKARELLLPVSVSRQQVRPIKVERRTKLLKSIARGRQWLDEITSGAAQRVEQIARRDHCSVRHINMTISLAFIAPGLVKAAVEGRLPRGIGVAALRDAPAEWSLQYERLGLIEPSKACSPTIST